MQKEDSVVYNEKHKRTSKWLIAIIVVIGSIFTLSPFVVMILSFFFFEDSVYTEFEETEIGEIVLKEDIKVSDTNGFYNEEDDTYYIQGYLENTSVDDIESIFIEYLVYDKDNVLLGTAYCSIDNLKSNTTWKFKAIYSDIDSNEVSKFELSKVEMY